MTINELKKEKIAILGLSREGISSAEFLSRHQIHFTILEKKQEKELGEELTKIKKWDCDYVFGENHLQKLIEYTLILRSPGISLFLPEIQEAKKNGVKISSHTKLFLELCPTQNTIGVTGTKGKGTTCKLIEAGLKADHKDVFVGGNIGQPPLDFLEKLTPKSYVILELSSFQIEDFEMSPHIAVILGIAPDHLAPESPLSPNYHHSFADYISAKKQLVRFQAKKDYIVVKKDDENAISFIQETKAKPYYFSRIGEVDRGGFVQNQKLILRKYSGQEFKNQKLLEIGEINNIKLKGKHHLENVCAALSVLGLLDCATLSIKKGLFEFKGYEHRLEEVATIRGVTYFDDSAATNPEPAIAAIDAFNEPVIVILGGSDKGQEYSQLAGKIVNSTVKVVYLIGDMAKKIGKEISNSQFLISKQFSNSKIQNKGSQNLKIIRTGYPSMKKIVQDCTKLARKGDVVLLSPACASFDMFENYRDRGDQFKSEVRKLGSLGY